MIEYSRTLNPLIQKSDDINAASCCRYMDIEKLKRKRQKNAQEQIMLKKHQNCQNSIECLFWVVPADGKLSKNHKEKI